MQFLKDRFIDIITVGRANVDFYPDEGIRLDEARRYHIYVGGSPANIAAAVAKRGLKAAIITRVANDPHGRFVCNYLAGLGIDVSMVQQDDHAKTSLAFAEVSPESQLCMYRENVADLNLEASLVSDMLIASAKALMVTGFAFALEPSRSSHFLLLDRANKAGLVTIMDIDYRPYNWLNLKEAAEVMSKAALMCDILIGTRAEFEIAGARLQDSDQECAQRFLDQGVRLVVLKRDQDGSIAFTQEGQIVDMGIFPVDIKKPFGAGDAYAGNLLSSLIEGYDLKTAMMHGAAAASMNILGTSCTEAMPNLNEIQNFIKENKKETV